jgi:hypothetical protein
MVNGSFIEDCSIIRSTDKIRPYFAVSVVDDPDLIGLLVYLQDSSGQIAGDKVQYTLQPYAGDVKQPPETEVQQETEPNESDEIPSEETEDGTTKRALWELPEEGAVAEKRTPVNTTPVVYNADIEFVIESFGEELPCFPLSKNLEPGSYTLIFEALGQRETLSRMETPIFYLGSVEFNLKDILIYLPGVSGSQMIPPGTTIMLEAKLDYNSRLDPYVIWFSGKSIVSQGKLSDGVGNILWTAPAQAGFYPLRLEVFPARLGRNISGISRDISLPVSSKAESSGYFFNSAPEFTAISSLATGTAYPEQFRLAMEGISLAEDADNQEEKNAMVLPSQPELLQWYQFRGNLSDSISALSGRHSLAPSDETFTRWAAAGQSYGLSVKPDDSYLLPPLSFLRAEEDQGGGIFLFHITPPAEGTLFSAFFPLRSSSTEGAWLSISREKYIITLRLNIRGTSVEMPIYLTPGQQDLIPVIVEFFIRPYRLEAKLSLGEPLQSVTGNIRLPGALTGEAKIGLGRTNTNDTIFTTTDDNTVDALNSVPENNFPASTIWDEFAVLFSTVPLLPEEIFVTVIPDEETTVIERDAAGEDATEIKAETQQEPEYHEDGETIMAEKGIDDAEYNVAGEKPIEL